MKKTIYAFLLAGLFSTQAHADNDGISPGNTWNDTKGSAINAHGGCVQYHDGYYYWFGESRNGFTWLGVRCYRSADLYNWTSMGIALAPSGTKTDANEDIAQGRLLERPKVIYNQQTGKWVMWSHWENGDDYGQAKVCVAQADKIEGPYTMTGVFRPNGCDSRDQTLFLDDDGTAYHIYSTKMNTNTNISPLNDDFLTPQETINTQMAGKKYEAAAIFKVDETYYGVFSGCTGWTPNRGRYAYAYDMMGDWTYGTDFKDQDGSTGVNFCTDNGKSNSYQSQSTYVFPVQGKDKCFVYMGDRWNSKSPGSSKYVWLPLSVRSGYPAVRWYDKWDISIFDDMYRYKRAADISDGGEFYLLEKYSDRIVSRPKASLTLENDGETNLCFVLHATDQEYIYKIEDKSTGKYMTSVFSSMRFMAESDDDAQKWVLWLEEDGYYRITNLSDGSTLSVSGNETLSGTTIYLNEYDNSIHQSFAFYFDSYTNEDYTEADMYSASYRESNRELMAEQANTLTAIDGIHNDAASAIVASIEEDGTMLRIKSNAELNADISVTDARSAITFWSGKESLNNGENRIALSTKLQSGIYILRVATSKQQIIKKIVF